MVAGVAPYAAQAPRARQPILPQLGFFLVGSAVIYLAATRLGLLVAVVVAFALMKLGAMRFLSRAVGAVLFSGSGRAAFDDALRRSDTMAHPITEKETESGSAAQLHFAVSSMQGWRRGMEDAHTTALGTTASDAHFFGVFDGHCGAAVAQFCGARIRTFVEATEGWKRGDYRQGLIEGFIAIDRYIASHADYRGERSGCTANVVVVTPQYDVYCANAGDSRAVMCRDGAALGLSTDHKPNLPGEVRRIHAARHFVFNKRVDGVLALSRAIGDFSFKDCLSVPWEAQAVTCVPDVFHVRADPARDQFIVVACDGIWDVMSNEQVVAFIRQKLAQGLSTGACCEALMTACLSPTPFGLGCDNMSVELIVFRPRSDAAATSSSPVAADCASAVAAASGGATAASAATDGP